MKLSSYAKQFGIHYNTLWRMWKRGELTGYQLPTGTVIIEPPVRSLPPSPSKSGLTARSLRQGLFE